MAREGDDNDDGSKEDCTLMVRGFPGKTQERDIHNLFTSYGEIQSLRIKPMIDAKELYAFVCFKKPEDARHAKENIPIIHKYLTINTYE